jgi:uncharacterized membrane protein YgcG
MKDSTKPVKPLPGRIWDFLSEPPAKGKLSNLTALILVTLLVGGIFLTYGYIIWLLSGSPATFRMVLKMLLFVGLPILILSFFETGRKILMLLFVFLQLIMCVLNIFSKERDGGFSAGGGESGGGGASGKW